MAIRLKRETAASWVDIGKGASMLCSPPSTVLVHAARAAAKDLFVELMQSGEAVTKAGGSIIGVPDLTDPLKARGMQDALFVVSLAELAATDWKNINDEDDAPIEFDGALIAPLLQDSEVADKFLANYLHPLNQVASEGNA